MSAAKPQAKREQEAEARFKALAAQGNPARGLALLAPADAQQKRRKRA